MYAQFDSAIDLKFLKIFKCFVLLNSSQDQDYNEDDTSQGHESKEGHQSIKAQFADEFQENLLKNLSTI